MQTFSTDAELHALLKPYERVQFRRTFHGPNDCVDLHRRGSCFRSADIRDVTPEGVEVFFYRDVELIPFADIDRVVIRYADLYNTLSRTEYVRADLVGMAVAA